LVVVFITDLFIYKIYKNKSVKKNIRQQIFLFLKKGVARELTSPDHNPEVPVVFLPGNLGTCDQVSYFSISASNLRRPFIATVSLTAPSEVLNLL